MCLACQCQHVKAAFSHKTRMQHCRGFCPGPIDGAAATGIPCDNLNNLCHQESIFIVQGLRSIVFAKAQSPGILVSISALTACPLANYSLVMGAMMCSLCKFWVRHSRHHSIEHYRDGQRVDSDTLMRIISQTKINLANPGADSEANLRIA